MASGKNTLASISVARLVPISASGRSARGGTQRVVMIPERVAQAGEKFRGLSGEVAPALLDQGADHRPSPGKLRQRGEAALGMVGRTQAAEFP